MVNFTRCGVSMNERGSARSAPVQPNIHYCGTKLGAISGGAGGMRTQ
jgi:hypothetical protein